MIFIFKGAGVVTCASMSFTVAARKIACQAENLPHFTIHPLFIKLFINIYFNILSLVGHLFIEKIFFYTKNFFKFILCCFCISMFRVGNFIKPFEAHVHELICLLHGLSVVTSSKLYQR